jgi:hypothetical protein
MILKDDAFYPINEVVDFIGWSKRKLQRYAAKNNLRKIDGRYLFTGLDVKKLKDISDSVATKSRNDTPENVQLDLEVESQKAENSASNNQVPEDLITLIKDIDNEDYVRAMLVAVKEDKHLEEFTPEEYKRFEEQLKDSLILEKRIEEYKEEIQRMENYVQDYRNNIEYLKKSLDGRAKETDLILKSIIQKNVLDAKREGIKID